MMTGPYVWSAIPAESFDSMIKFLLICPTSVLEKIFNPQICCIFLRLKIVSALNLNKFPKNLIIESPSPAKNLYYILVIQNINH